MNKYVFCKPYNIGKKTLVLNEEKKVLFKHCFYVYYNHKNVLFTTCEVGLDPKKLLRTIIIVYVLGF